MLLRESLGNQDQDLYHRLNVIENKAKELLEYSQGGDFLYYTPHGYSHISRVETNCEWLLSENDIKSLNSTELFCLLCAIFFHDAFMIPTHLGGEKDSRDKHAKKAQDFLNKEHKSLNLTIHEAHVISEIILGHSLNSLEKISEGYALGSSLVNIRKLSSILSLADICHADASRAPEMVYTYLDFDEESAKHWKRHFQISGITRRSDHIVMSAIYFSDDGLQAIEDYRNLIEKQLQIVKPYFTSQLSPINKVELQAQRYKSQLDIPLRFQANTSAILNLLIEGIYQRKDVFLRELVQNSLDACQLRFAKTLRRNEIYHPQIVITLLSSQGKLKGIRVDDNGVGMDISDVQNTLLWIGNTIANRQDIKNLLNDTTRKNLIATFGVGLLSCFQVAKSIAIKSAKEGQDPIQFEIKSVLDHVILKESNDWNFGSTFYLELKDDFILDLNIDTILCHYFRMIAFTPVKVLKLDYYEEVIEKTRDDIFKIALSEAKSLEPISIIENESLTNLCQIKGDDYVSWFWVQKRKEENQIETNEGKIAILNEGIFVTEAPTCDWLPQYLKSCCGIINFSAKAIDLPISRDSIMCNKKYFQKKEELEFKSIDIIKRLIIGTNIGNNDERNFAAIMISYFFTLAKDEQKKRILYVLDNYNVQLINQNRETSLISIAQKKPWTVYLKYDSGRWVDDLCIFDGKKLYHKSEDLTSLQSALLTQEGEIVLETKRMDPNDLRILEANLLIEYFKYKNIKLIDLVRNTVIDGKIRSKSLPKKVRENLSYDIKFLEVPGLINKRCWKVKNETWINISNPQMEELYKILQSGSISPEKIDVAKIMIEILTFNFDNSVNDLFTFLKNSR